MKAVKNTKSYIKELLSELADLNKSQAEGAFRMCQIYAAFKEQRLYEVMDFYGFGQFIEQTESITHSKSTAAKWANFYSLSREFGYNATECREMLSYLSVNAAYGQITRDSKKTSVSSFVRRCRKDYLSSKYQLNFGYDSLEELEIIEKALEKFGMVKHETGTRTNSSEAMLQIAKRIK